MRSPRKFDRQHRRDDSINQEIRPVRMSWPFWLSLSLPVLVCCAILIASWVVMGQHRAEKLAKLLIAPVGLLWIGLWTQTCWSIAKKKKVQVVFGLGSAVFLTLAGNGLVKNGLAGLLEGEYLRTDPFQSTGFDVLVVLGGGAGIKPNGQPQLLASGDRLALAVQLFHAGKVGQIVTMGAFSAYASESSDANNECTRDIMLKLKVPLERITQLPGKTTAEEAAAFANWYSQEKKSKPMRIGLLTSAWHMKRAKSLFRDNGIETTEVPADFLTEALDPVPALLVPSVHNVEAVTRLMHEHLGIWLGR